MCLRREGDPTMKSLMKRLHTTMRRDLKRATFPANGRDLDELVYEAKMDEIVQDQCVDGYFPREESTAPEVGRAALETKRGKTRDSDRIQEPLA
jgi:hypothetical protein